MVVTVTKTELATKKENEDETRKTVTTTVIKRATGYPVHVHQFMAILATCASLKIHVHNGGSHKIHSLDGEKESCWGTLVEKSLKHTEGSGNWWSLTLVLLPPQFLSVSSEPWIRGEALGRTKARAFPLSWLRVKMGLLGPATQGRKTLQPTNEGKTLSPLISDGMCKTMAETQGYACEEHKVTTEDGYILGLQRMPVGRFGKKADKPPVLLQHGLFMDGLTWIFNSPNESFGFILADSGYDVWLANTRGTKYSSDHKSLNPNDQVYWDWSWDELARYDLPAFVQYVYNYTGQRIHYAGHSLGTLIALAAFSQGQVLNMLRSAALLSPIAHMNQITSPPTKLAAHTFLADDVYWLGLREIIPNGDAAAKFVEGICHSLHLNCLDLVIPFTGPNCCVNSSKIDVYLDHLPQPTAAKNLIHLSQMIRTGIIARYDYGDLRQNMQHYGQPTPPMYDMAKIPNEFPLFLSYGGLDMLSDVRDVQLLLGDLKDHDGNKLVVLLKEDYAHMDFVLGVNAKQMIYDPLIDFFKEN
ncbi:hypothetical protein VNO77_44864 [Canavalia gladiata]|uniref:Partial AB-hydrolase lipase domain-containing protein n=1 Tax=Canavalia gladiata TaxID=3824 RepID=A0AAN9PRF3_CANGL